MARTEITKSATAPRLAGIDLDAPPVDSKAAARKHLSTLQKRLLRVQQTYWHERRRAILVFEGWDAAGKGGAIRRLTAQLDPRGFHVWPIGTPSASEQGRHYLWRFWQRLPEPGTLAIFDRSWYGRVLVERVQGFARPEEWQRAYDEINEFERLLVDDGARFVKMFLHISPEEQLDRFRKRLLDPTKRWKLTEEDLRNRERRTDYVEAIDEMFERTSTELAPWHAVAAESKHHARVRVLEIVTEALERGVEVTPPPIDPAVRTAAEELLGR